MEEMRLDKKEREEREKNRGRRWWLVVTDHVTLKGREEAMRNEGRV